MSVRMLKLDRAIRDRYEQSSLQCAVHAAAPCPVAIKEEDEYWKGHRTRLL